MIIFIAMKFNLPYLIIIFFFIACETSYEEDYINWSEYLGSADKSHYTTLDQISKENLDSLELAWTYESPDTGQMQMNPIIVDGTLYGVSAALKAFAIDAKTGQEKWVFGEYDKVWHSTSRGLAYWEKGMDKRILYTMGKDLLALDAETGKLVKSFGDSGRVDLHLGLPEVAQDKFIISNTPGTIYKDIIVMPTRVSEGSDAAPGDIRAFNIIDGSLAWTFHVIPHPEEPGYESWENKNAYRNEDGIGAGNNWAGMTVDNETGIIYIPTGSIAPDFYGGDRLGKNLYSNCLLALNATNGNLIWHQQLVHHDIWDRDLPAPPNLLSVERNGKMVKAVAQVTKQGYVFLFNRKTGEALFDIEEKSFPASKLEGEEAWPTQPIPSIPLPFARRSDQISPEDVSPYAPNKDEIEARIAKANRNFYAPPDTTPVLLLPGYDGAAEWGGAGVDPEEGIMYINSNEMAWLLRLEKSVQEKTKMTLGEIAYLNYCAACHGKDLKGNESSGYPSLLQISERLDKVQILNVINNGKGMMTGYSHLKETEKNAIISFLIPNQETSDKLEVTSPFGPAYRHTGYHKLLDANGLPGISPPWGTLCAIDMNSGEFLWQIPFGEVDSLANLGIPDTGTENYGGPIITQNGLLIIAATKDDKIRIYDRSSGEELWEDDLPASSFATPATYMIDGKQFIARACGGEKLGTKPGNKIIAYALK